MLRVNTSSQSAGRVTSPITPTPEMQGLAERVTKALVTNGFMQGWVGNISGEHQAPEIDFMASTFCGLKKNSILTVASNAANLSIYCGMKKDDITNYVTWSGYRIKWLDDGKHLKVY